MIGSYTNETVIISAPGAKDKWGEPGASTSETVKARVEEGNYILRNTEGQDIVSNIRVFMKKRTLQYDYKITYSGNEYSIAKIEHLKDFSMVYLVVYLI